MILSVLVLPLAAFGQSDYSTPYTFTTLAGNVGYGSADGSGSAGRFDWPAGVAVDSAGNVHVADTWNHTIRKVTPAGVAATLAGLAGSWGSADGTATAARFDHPSGVALDGAGNLYVADFNNHTIRKVSPTGGVTTLAGASQDTNGDGWPDGGYADGSGSAARFSGPYGVATDTAGSVYVADCWNHTIRRVTPAGVVTTLAGLSHDTDGDGLPDGGYADGTGSAARFYYPSGVAVDGGGNAYVADWGNHTIREVTPAGVVTTLAGLAGSHGNADGTGSAARFWNPSGVAVDSAGNVYVADTLNCTIRKVAPTGVVTTLAGGSGPGSADGTGSAARFSYPTGVAVDSAGNVYVADRGNHTIRKVTPAGVVTTLAGRAGGYGSADGIGSTARFGTQYDGPEGVAVDSGGKVHVADTSNHTVRNVTPAGVVTTLAGLAGSSGSADGTGSGARFRHPSGVAVDSAVNAYVADTENHMIRKVTPAGVVTTLAGLTGSPGSADGTGSAAQFRLPTGVAVDGTGNVYVADTLNHTIRKVTPAGGVTTLAGRAGFSGIADGTGSAARFYQPTGVTVDRMGIVYVADSWNNAIRKVTPAGAVTTLAGLAEFDVHGSPVGGSADGTGSAARFDDPRGVAVDGAGNLYVVDRVNNAIRKITPAGLVTTLAGLAGSAGWGSADGTGSAARFRDLRGVAVDGAGNIYVADAGNNTIRKGIPASSVPAPTLQPPNLSAGQFGFGIAGLPGLAVDIESSGDLSQWQVVSAYVLEGGTNCFVSPTLPQGTQFYRSHTR